MPSPTPSTATGPSFKTPPPAAQGCAIAKAVLADLATCAKAKPPTAADPSSLVELIDKFAGTGYPGEPYLKLRTDKECAETIAPSVRVFTAGGCKLSVSDEQLAQLAALAAWRQTTVLAPSGDAASDAQLAAVAAVRDEGCACKDEACSTAFYHSVDDKLMGLSLPETATDSARDQMAHLIDDIHDCQLQKL